MGIWICSNKGTGPISDHIRTILINLQKSSHEPLARQNALIFGMDNSWVKEIKVCSNKVARVVHGQPAFIGILHGASLGHGDSILFK